jgi:hypothetical protein
MSPGATPKLKKSCKAVELGAEARRCLDHARDPAVDRA